MSTVTATVYRDNSRTCIVIDRADKVTFVSLAHLRVEVLAAKAFDARYKPYPEYPVRRAAELYLGCKAYRSIQPQAREHLSRIVADKATLYPTFDLLQGKPEMAKKPARNGLNTVVESATAKPAAKGAKGKPAPAAVKAKPVAEKPAAKGKPAAEKPAAKTEAAKPARTKVEDTAKYKIGDTSSVKRGFLQEYVEKASGLKVFTREKLEALYGGRQADAKMGTYFPYCVGKGIFSAVL